MQHSIRGGDSASAPPGTRTRTRRLTAGVVATVLGLGLSLTGMPAAHAAGTYFCPDSTQPYVPVAEVEAFSAGTAVTGLSVTQGTSPDAFTGTYVGFIADALGKGKDLLLFKLSSPVIDGTAGLKPAGIWAGMSGSPVYTADAEHRLIGAVSYSLNADNLPIAGVTPAEYMKSIGTTALGTSAKVKVTSANLRASADSVKAAGATLAGSTLSQVKAVDVAGAAGAKQNAFTNRTLARTPKSADGASYLRSGNFRPAAALDPDGVRAPLKAGGNIAALYSSGDLIVGAIGTVTAVCGNTVWAFGHSMNFAGETKLLMSNASIAMVVPDATGMSGSYKQASAFGAPVGLVTQDRFVGIRGTVGATNSFGIDVAVQNASGAKVTSYHTEVANQDVAATVVAYLTGQAAYEQLDQYSSGTGRLTWTIDYKRADGSAESLKNTQITADATSFPDTVATPPANDVWAITSNEFENVTLTGVHLTLRLLSSKAVTYKASDVQLLGKAGHWGTLDGRKLKAGKTYSVRPAYRVQANGKPTGTAVGGTVKFKLSSKARKSGYFQFASATDSSQDCITTPDGSTLCVDFGDDEDAGGYADFDDLIASLTDEPSNSDVTASLYYKLKKGSTSRDYAWTGPGVVTGSVKDYFLIK